MSRKANTIDLKGNDYAKVAERIKLFREDCPNGLIETSYQLDDGVLIFTAIAVKDQAKQESAKATGHAMGNMTGSKSFEKLETVAVGRALALLGYLASGEIASDEEMTEFNAYKQEKKQQAIDEAIEMIESAKTLEELKEVYKSIGVITDQAIIDAKDRRKAELNADN